MRSNYFNMLMLIAASLLISVFLNQDRIVRVFYNDAHKHAVPIASSRTFLGDEYHYYVEANDSLKLGLISKDKVYSTNNVLLGSLLASGLINTFWLNVISSSDIAVLISLIVQTWLLVLAMVYLLKVMSAYDDKNSGLWVGFWAFIALILADYFLINSYSGAFNAVPLLSYYPNILRVVNPQMGWAFAFFYLALLYKYSEQCFSGRLLFLSIMSLLFGFFSPALCLTTTLAMCLITSWDSIKNKAINYPYLLLSFLLSVSCLFNYIQLHEFQNSAKGLEIGTGVIHGVVFNAHYFIFMLLIIPMALYYKNRQFIILTSILLSAMIIGAFCETLFLGERLWIRGAGMYVWVLCILVASNLFKQKIKSQLIPATGIIVLSVWSFFLVPHQFDNDYGYVNQAKWEVIDWINKNLPSDSIIMSDDLEFSYLLPLYSKSQPFVPLFSYSNLSAEDTVKKYYYTLDKFKTRTSIQKVLNEFDLQKNYQNLLRVMSGKELDDDSFVQNAFFNYLIYFPFTKFSASAFNSEEDKAHFFKVLDSWSKEPYSGDKKTDYVLIKAAQYSYFSSDYQPVFKTDKFMLLSKKYNILNKV